MTLFGLDGRRRGMVLLRAGMPGKAAMTAVALFAALAMGGSVARAEERVVTLDEAYRLSLRSHESIGIASEGVAQFESNLGKAVSLMMPKVTAEGTYTSFSEKKMSGNLVLQPDDTTTVDLKVTQPIYQGGKEWSARRQARMLVQKSREGYDSVRESIIRATARAYFNVLKTGKDVEIKKAAINRAVERRKVAEARFKVGEVTKSAVLRADADEAGADAELKKSLSSFTDAMNSLGRIIGVSPGFTVADPALSYDIKDVPEDLVRKAYEHRRDYKQALLDEKVASENVTYAIGGFLPTLSVVGLYEWKDQNPQTTFFYRDSLSASVVLSYPIFEGGLRKAEVDEARSKYRESELRRLGMKKDIDVDVRQAYNYMESVKTLIDSYRKQVDYSRENYNMVFEQFKYGLATTVDVIDADVTLISAERSLMNASYDYALSVLELKYSAGVLLDDVSREARLDEIKRQ